VDRNQIQLIGLAAGTLTTLSFVPQVIRAWRTRSVNDLSMEMLVTFNIGVALWTVYGIALGEFPIILTNSITLGLALILLVFKLRGQRFSR
jgi:MtN3 and saliva related transmembrane protein